MKMKTSHISQRRIRICALPFAALFAVSATAANISWNGATDAVWSTGGNWVGGVAPSAADVAVFDAASVANLSATLGVDRTIQGLKITTPGGLITIGAGNLLTLGAGGIDMSAASQNLLINALLALASDQSWNVAAGRTLTANGVISGTNVNLNKIGLGDLILGGANTFTGTTTIGGGALTLNGSLNGTTGTDLTFAGTGTFNVSAASGVSQGMKVLRFNSGEGTVRSTNNGGTSTVSFTSRAARAAGATGNFVISGGTAGTPGSPGTLGTNNITIGGELTAQLLDRGLFYNGAQYTAYDAGGFVRGLIYGTDANAQAISAGATLGVNDATQNVEISGNITAQTTASVNTISDPGTFTITLAGGQTLSLNGFLKSGGNAATISGGTGITTTAPNNEMVIRTNAAGDTLTISTPIVANGTSSLTKSGDGTMIFSAANNYAGVTSINAGVLQIGAGGTSGSLGTGNVNNSASLVFNRSDSFTVSNLIGGNGSLTKSGAGTVTLSGVNSYSGVTSILSGVLSVGATNNLGDGSATNSLTINNGTLRDTGIITTNRALTVSNTSTLDGGTGTSLTLTGAITTTASGATLQKTGAGVLNLYGNVFKTTDLSSTPRRLFINAGTLNISGSTAYLTRFVVGGSGVDVNVVATNSNITSDGNSDNGDLNIGFNSKSSYDMHGGYLTTIWGGIYMGMNGGGANLTIDNTATLNLNTAGNNQGSASEWAMGDGGSNANAGKNNFVTIRGAGTKVDISANGVLRVGIAAGSNNVINQINGTVYLPYNTGGNTAFNAYPTAGLSMQYRMNREQLYAIYNLNGGTLTVGSILNGDDTPFVDSNNSYLNFHGGALRPSGNEANFVRTTITGANTARGATRLTVYSEGAVIDTNGFEMGLQVPLIAAQSSGAYVTGAGSLTLAALTEGAGYQATPQIILTDAGLTVGSGTATSGSAVLTGLSSTANILAGARIYGSNIPTGARVVSVDTALNTVIMDIPATSSGGTGAMTVKGQGATAVANMVDDGTGNGTLKISSLTITNPGVGYAIAPAISISHGAPTTPATFSTLTTAPNVSGGLTKSGLGTLTLSAANTYTGVTTISGGTLQIGNGGTAGSITTTSNVVNNGVLAFNRTDNYGGDFTRIISGSGSVKVSGGVLTFPGTNTYTGATILSGGTLSVASNANFGDGGALIFDGGTLQVTGTVVNNFDGHAPTFNAGKTVGIDVNSAANTIIVTQPLNQGAGGLMKLGAGKLILTAANTYTGLTTISGGTLQIGNGGSGASISSSSGIVMSNDSELVFNVADNTGFTHSIIGAGSLLKTGTGTLTLLGSDAYTGQTTVNAGTLVVNGTITGSTTVESGAVLGGTGTTGSVTVSGGVLAPGDPGTPGSIGDLTINGNVSFSGSSALNIQFDYDIPSKDLLNLAGTGALAISNGAMLNVSVSVTDLDVARSYINQPLTIIDYADGGWSSSGPGNNVFAGMNDDQAFVAPSGFTYIISYDGAGGVSEVTLTLVSVPEPSMAVSLLGGLGLLLGMRRRDL